jgi:hypothetical protein
MKDEKSRLTLNRIVAFVAGGLLVFLVMSATVVSVSNKQVADLKQQLDASVYEPGKLMAEAKAEVLAKDYKKAGETLNALFEKHPGSNEAVQGKILYDSAMAAEKKANDKWDVAVVGIRNKWASQEGLRLRTQYEKDLGDTLNQEWDKVKDQMRSDWLKD